MQKKIIEEKGNKYTVIKLSDDKEIKIRHPKGRDLRFAMSGTKTDEATLTFKLASNLTCLSEAELDELLSSLEGLDRVREEIAWVRMDFELEPVGAESLACHLCCEDSFLSVAHTAGVRKELDVRILGDVGEEVVVSVVELDTLHCYCDHLCL